MKKQDWEKYFKEKEENPFKDYPLGVWYSHYTHFCPQCGKPIFLCVCSLKKIEKNN
jgi:rRNA maturation endonuclease Nob1